MALSFDPSHPDSLAVYCSDGRFTEAVEDLLRSQGHPRLDTMTLPGGPALFVLTTADFAGLETVRAAASFLVRGHAIRHVFLLAHEGCGYYRARNPGQPPEAVARKQVAELREAAAWFQASLPEVSVALYYARVAEARVAFDAVGPS